MGIIYKKQAHRSFEDVTALIETNLFVVGIAQYNLVPVDQGCVLID